MKNSRILQISFISVLIIIPMIFVVALASWFITDQKTTKPTLAGDDDVKKILVEYLDNHSGIYNGNILLPSAEALGVVENARNQDITYSFKTSNEENYIECNFDSGIGPINRGDYQIKISYVMKYNDDEGIEQSKEYVVENIKFTINPQDLNDGGCYITTNHSVSGYEYLRYEYYEYDSTDSTTHQAVKPKDVRVFQQGGKKLLSGSTDYDISYDALDTDEPGQIRTITVTGKGNYTGTLTKQYQIYKQLFVEGDTTQRFVYSNMEQSPSIRVVDKKGNIVSQDVYTLTTSSTIRPINVGSYSYTYNVKPNDSSKYEGVNNVKVTLIITPKPISSTLELIQIDYNSSNRTWSDIGNNITNQLKTATLNGVIEGTTVGISSFTMTDGTFMYDSTKTIIQDSKTGLDSSYSYAVGGTYLMTPVLNNTNYTLSNKIYVKYKTVMINNAQPYYTIEDAIATATSSQYINFPGDNSGTNKYVYTAFCNLDNLDTNLFPNYTSNHTYATSGKIILQYASNSSTAGKDKDKNGCEPNLGDGNVYTALYISEKTILNINSNGVLYIDSYITQKSNTADATVSTNRGVVMNNGTINVASGGKIYAYGYLKSSEKQNDANTKSLGEVITNSGSTVVECFRNYDFPGGTVTLDIATGEKKGFFNHEKHAMPMNAWSLHNISCKIKIKSGTNYKGFYFINAKLINKVAVHFDIFSGNSSAKCLFYSTDSNAYIEKETKYDVNKNIYKIAGSNQIKNQKDEAHIYGTWNDSNLTIKVSVYSLATNTDVSCPISHLDIVVSSGAKLNLTKSDYLFLPGTKLIVEKGGNLITVANVDLSFETMSHLNNSSVSNGSRNFKKYCYEQKDAEFVVNGTATIGGNIGGIITSTKTGGTISLSNVTSSFYSLYNIDNTRTYGITGYNAIGKFDESSKYYRFQKATYTSQIVNGVICWSGSRGSEQDISNNGSLRTATA